MAKDETEAEEVVEDVSVDGFGAEPEGFLVAAGLIVVTAVDEEVVRFLVGPPDLGFVTTS